jgi:hypothetical protein
MTDEPSRDATGIIAAILHTSRCVECIATQTGADDAEVAETLHRVAISLHVHGRDGECGGCHAVTRVYRIGR